MSVESILNGSSKKGKKAKSAEPDSAVKESIKEGKIESIDETESVKDIEPAVDAESFKNDEIVDPLDLETVDSTDDVNNDNHNDKTNELEDSNVVEASQEPAAKVDIKSILESRKPKKSEISTPKEEIASRKYGYTSVKEILQSRQKKEDRFFINKKGGRRFRRVQ